jgi:hypothetical protein
LQQTKRYGSRHYPKGYHISQRVQVFADGRRGVQRPRQQAVSEVESGGQSLRGRLPAPVASENCVIAKQPANRLRQVMALGRWFFIQEKQRKKINKQYGKDLWRRVAQLSGKEWVGAALHAQ